jgi:cytochrome b561
MAPAQASGIVTLLEQRDQLADRITSLARRQRLFGLWHVFHLPLVWVMFSIVALHVGLALYLGYWPI